MSYRSSFSWAMLLLSLLITCPLQADEGTLRFQIQIEPHLLQDVASSGAPEGEKTLVPCPGVFVVLDERRARRHPYARPLKEWLDKVCQPQEPKPVTLEIKNGQFVPRLLTIRTGAPIVQGNYVNNLAFDTFVNPAFGTLGRPGTKYVFQESEPLIVKFRDTAGTQVGFMTVKNHPYAAISDEEGKLSFTGVPLGEKLPMRVMCPLLARGTYEVTSDDGNVLDNGKLVVTLSDDERTEVKLWIRQKDASR